MFEANREAGQQAHRELNRHIHNFVASAKSLVDHTRVFLNASYAKSAVFETIQLKIKSTFSESPVTAFVHDLRNYMVHKGLPNSHMFFDWRQDPSAGAGPQVTSGIRFDTKSLAGWSSWTAPAKRYMEQCGEHIDIHRFTDEYVVAVTRFHAWLEHTQHITLDSAGFHFSNERSLPSFRIDSVGDLCTRYAHITCTAEAADNAFIRR